MGEGFLGPLLWPLAWVVIKVILLLAPVLFMVTYITLAERKVIGAMQVRPGPNRVGFFGILQPLADAVKLIFKETILPTKANKGLFLLAPLLTLVPALLSWAVVPFSPELILADINVGILYILAISSLGAYGIIISGWASNSRYAFLGSMRSVAQMVSYEVSMGFTLIPVILLTGSLSLVDVVEQQKDWWNVIPLAPMFLIYFISVVAETNRSPFDLPEAEPELVAGFLTEYSAMSSGLFFMGEYANIVLVSFLGALVFLGGWLPPLAILSFIPGIIWLGLKAAFLMFVFLWIRATFPRYRYDQLMRLGWKVFLPVSLFWIFLTGLVIQLYRGM
ncbi:MAG: NADH-quinone oxidoreductase subunit NuoH [Magnetococcales bacterium]|nr:NADH-quinone oxidoreductase subunit NuoH [Magnetococcales bacterium]MBF0149245.1 NADH-quinone oxidoreductase subunit NuoH [Magnetococcales bacterium]MBF0174305.1 NADH-quinone oxidoreductase subunit NuoH [Magnetococcales bacterium]MBF0348398.1 NADH-quinone oxidoreductase subunit NuoH [Magnetococcales bacterium]MBF0632417.1 NADH-quinone oxidoreductase subunit NuoH [Magnetococcales bacterium]